jgi:hypothetical protein
MMTVGLRWEASGVTGGLFPALDADIRLSEDDDDKATVELTGSYRPPLGTVGAELDRLVLRTVAAATIRALLSRIGDVLDGDKEGAAVLEAWSPEPLPVDPPAQAAFVPRPAVG